MNWQEIKQWEPQIIDWRRHIHRYPELSFGEYETTAYLIRELEKIGGWRLQRLADTGVVAELEGGRPGRKIALRADIDALPIEEATGLEFSSVNKGVMHACGHDSHAAMLLGAAAWLAAQKDSLAGSYRLIFQAGEEVMPGGARALVDAGVLEGVDAIVGQHIMPNLQSGEIGVCSTDVMAAVADFHLVVRGRGGHAAQPHTCCDPIPIAAEIVGAIQRLVSRETNALIPLVVSNTIFQAGNEATNVIPETVRLGGTVRTFDHALYQEVPRRIVALAEQIAAAYGATVEHRIEYGPVPTVNHPQISALVKKVVVEAFGQESLIESTPLMVGEDFGAYLTAVPGAFFFLGVSKPKETVYPLHHPKLNIDENALRYGTEILLRSAVRLADPATDIGQ